MKSMHRRTVLGSLAAAAAVSGSALAIEPRERPQPKFKVITTGLRFPEGPVALADGSLLVCEIAAGCVTRVAPDGTKSVAAQVGGGPNGAAMGPDGFCFVVNNGGLSFNGPAPEEPLGSVQKFNVATGAVSTVYRMVNGHPLNRPNDIVFDRTGGFWFTDAGRAHARSRDYSGVYWGKADGSEVREVIFPGGGNGIAISPDGKTLYTTGGREINAYEIVGPGQLAEETSWLEFGRPKTGRRIRRRTVVSLGGEMGFDSMRVDSAGNIVVCTMFTGGLTVISPDGKTVDHVPLPDAMTTNLAFGGPDLRTAFVCQSNRGEIVAFEWPRPGLRLPNQ